MTRFTHTHAITHARTHTHTHTHPPFYDSKISVICPTVYTATLGENADIIIILLVCVAHEITNKYPQ